MPDEKKTCKCCDKKEELVEIKEEDLDKVSGGYMKDGVWHCDYCGKAFESVKSNRDVITHFRACDKSPYFKK